MERALRKAAEAKGFTGERKDRYIYGAMRARGWKPSREKKMSDESKIIRLQQISSKLDKIIAFKNDDDDDHLGRDVAIAGGVGTAGAAGLYGIGARQGMTIPSPGGVMINRPGVPTWGGAARQLGGDISNIGRGGGTAIGQTIKQGWQSVFAPKISSALSTGGEAIKTAAGNVGAPLAAELPSAAKTGVGEALRALRKPVASVLHAASAKHKRLVQLSKKLDDVIEFAGDPADPTAGMFGGNDPGILNQTYEDSAKVSALQRLKLKIARLRGMGLYNY